MGATFRLLECQSVSPMMLVPLQFPDCPSIIPQSDETLKTGQLH